MSKDAEKVTAYMAQLEHPLKAEIEALRELIKGVDASISERIKWNAPSYYTSADFLTFNHRMTDKVHLIFHHVSCVEISSPLLEGDYKDRRMMYLRDMAAIEENRDEIIRIVRESVRLIG